MISKSPELKQNFLLPILHTSAARIGFRKILEGIDFAQDSTLLIPAYIGITDREGSGVFDPIISTAVKHQFYRVDKRLEPDYEQIKILIERGGVKALLLIHYFGFPPASIWRIKSLCEVNNVLLIEDCAHTMSGSIDGHHLGTLGYASFYSVHKYLPVTSGGYAYWNEGITVSDALLEENEKINEESLKIMAIADMDRIAQVRVDNYFSMLEKLSDFEEINIMHSEPEPGIIPLNFPVLIEGLREKVYFNMLNKGIPTIALYYRLIEPIKEQDFPDSHYVSKNILNLPIHQDMSEADIEKVVNSLKESVYSVK